jgi:hypothetical protein
MCGDIGDAWLGEQPQHAQPGVRTPGEPVLVEVDSRLRVADRGGDVAHPRRLVAVRPAVVWPAVARLPVARPPVVRISPGGQAESVLDQRERALLVGGVQDTGKREDLPERGGHRPSLGTAPHPRAGARRLLKGGYPAASLG